MAGEMERRREWSGEDGEVSMVLSDVGASDYLRLNCARIFMPLCTRESSLRMLVKLLADLHSTSSSFTSPPSTTSSTQSIAAHHLRSSSCQENTPLRKA
jgi:hypothetical protein